MSAQQNEGEGNQTEAKRYNEAQAKFAKSGKVAEAAENAKEALEGPEREALEEAEAKGKSHAKK
ncbi:MAG: hypothetical protein WAK01_14755 [Methylocystis sp.]